MSKISLEEMLEEAIGGDAAAQPAEVDYTDVTEDDVDDAQIMEDSEEYHSDSATAESMGMILAIKMGNNYGDFSQSTEGIKEGYAKVVEFIKKIIDKIISAAQAFARWVKGIFTKIFASKTKVTKQQVDQKKDAVKSKLLKVFGGVAAAGAVAGTAGFFLLKPKVTYEMIKKGNEVLAIQDQTVKMGDEIKPLLLEFVESKTAGAKKSMDMSNLERFMNNIKETGAKISTIKNEIAVFTGKSSGGSEVATTSGLDKSSKLQLDESTVDAFIDAAINGDIAHLAKDATRIADQSANNVKRLKDINRVLDKSFDGNQSPEHGKVLQALRMWSQLNSNISGPSMKLITGVVNECMKKVKVTKAIESVIYL